MTLGRDRVRALALPVAVFLSGAVLYDGPEDRRTDSIRNIVLAASTEECPRDVE
jgi:hypothetical protein